MDFHVEQMTRDEVDLAIKWAQKEGWNPGLHDAECFYRTDPHGFFAGKLNGQLIAVGSAVVYDTNFAFCGFYIVEKAYREKGYGLQLTHERLAYVGARNAGIDGVLEMVDNYARIGYHFAHQNARYSFIPNTNKPKVNESIVWLQTIPLTQISEYDRRFFPAYRPQFIEPWIKQEQSSALAFVANKQLQGYGVIRKCYEGYKIGPLFADTPMIAEALFMHLIHHAQGERVFIDIPENNPQAQALVNHYAMNKVFATARMYLRGEPLLFKDGIYGITTFELG